MSTALFHVTPRSPADDAGNQTTIRKSNHLLARIFGDSVIQRESFKFNSNRVAQDTDAAIAKRQKYATEIPELRKDSLEPKLIHAPKDRLAPNPNVHRLRLNDLEQMERQQQGYMIALLIAGSAMLAWLFSTKLSTSK